MVTPDIQFAGDYLPTTSRLPCLDGCPIVANLECAIADHSSNEFQKAHKLILNSDAYDLVTASGVEAFSLANNHTLDAGPTALSEMTVRLKQLGIQHYGTMDCPTVEIQTRSGLIAVIGCIEKCRSRGNSLFPEERVEALIKQIRNRYKRIYITPHWGKESEFCLYPSNRIMRLAAKWTSAGADGVFGHHPHTIHGARRDLHRPVFFSLGGYAFQHAAVAPHPLANIGLVVSVDCSTNTATERFVFCDQERSREITGEVSILLHEKLEQLSTPLTANWSAWKWARHDGLDYLSQANSSWRIRFTKSSTARTMVLWSIWNLTPTTILARLGSLFTASESSSIRSELNHLATQLADTRNQSPSFPHAT